MFWSKVCFGGRFQQQLWGWWEGQTRCGWDGGGGHPAYGLENPPRLLPFDLPGLWAESTGPTKLSRLHGRNQPSPPTVLHALDPVPSVLRVSTLGRSTSGPHPRSSPWCLTLVPRTSGYPLSTARVTPAVSDRPSAAAPAPSPPLRGQTLARSQAVARVGVGTEVAAELALTFPVVSLPSGRGPGRCTNPGSNV